MKALLIFLFLFKLQSPLAFNLNMGDQRFSGDIVGNGWERNDHDNPDNLGDHEHLRLKRFEIKKRNTDFQEFLNEMEFDEREFQSGDIVGNGSGFHENQAAFFYQSLSKNIVSSLQQHAVHFDEIERRVLMDILNILQEDSSKAKIIFINESEFKGFFYDSDLEKSPRIAKTGFDRSFPIFVNREMVEKRIDSSPFLWVSLLIHELGHQTGIASHSFLDKLGAKVRLVLSIGEESLTYPIIGTNGIKVLAINHYVSDGLPDMMVLYQNRVKGIEGWDVHSLKESCGANRFDGFHVINMHWKDKSFFGVEMNMTIPMGAWAHVRCQNMMSGAFYNQIINMDLKVEVGPQHLDLTSKFDF